MNTSLSLYRLLGAQDFFPSDPPKGKEYYAERIGTDKLQKFAAYFLSFNERRNLPSIERMLEHWFTFNQIHTYDKSPSYVMISQEYEKIKNFHAGERHSILSTEALLNLILWTQEQEHKKILKPVGEDASNTYFLFEINLLFNSDVLVNYQKAVDSIAELKDEKHLQRLTLAMSFPQSDLLNIDYQVLLYTQFYKAIKLLDYLDSTEKYKPLLTHVLKEYKCADKKEFVKRLGLAVALGMYHKSNWNELHVAQNEDYEKACFFLDKLALPDYVPSQVNLSPEEQEAEQRPDDYLSLREHPIKKTGEGTYMIIFDLFLIKKMYTGLTFIFSSTVNANPDLLKGHFFGSIRREFSEGVLLYEIMQIVYENVQNLKRNTGDELKAFGHDRESDYYVREGNTILLFESKDFFMPGEIKLSYNFRKIETALRYDTKGKPDKLGKAIVQLIHNINRVYKKEMIDTGYDAKDIYIYPVIITYDSLYNCAGLNYWVNFWLEDAISGLKEKGELKEFDLNRVKPVTIVDIDTLIMFHGAFNQCTFNLNDLILGFHHEVDYRRGREHDPEKYAYYSCIPFSEYVHEQAARHNIAFERSTLEAMLHSYGI